MREQYEIQALRDELAGVRAELARIETALQPEDDVADDASTAGVGRRGWMKAATGVAVGGTALALSGTQQAAAGNGDAIVIGNPSNTATLATTATKRGPAAGPASCSVRGRSSVPGGATTRAHSPAGQCWPNRRSASTDTRTRTDRTPTA